MGVNGEIDLTAEQRRLVLELIERHLPDTDVWAYGSRVKWTSRPDSDLDLVVFSGPEQNGRVSDLREAFEDSDLPFRVDVLTGDDLPESFLKQIDHEHYPLTYQPSATPLTRVQLGECARLVRDVVEPGQVNAMTPYIGLEHIVKHRMVVYAHGLARDVGSTKLRFRKGDVLFGKLRPYFRKVVRAAFDGICSTDIWVVRTADSSRMDQGFLFYCMAQQKFVDFATLGSEGTRMPRAEWDHVSRYVITLPALAGQRAIANVLGSLDGKINVNIREVDLLIQMRNLLLGEPLADVSASCDLDGSTRQLLSKASPVHQIRAGPAK